MSKLLFSRVQTATNKERIYLGATPQSWLGPKDQCEVGSKNELPPPEMILVGSVYQACNSCAPPSEAETSIFAGVLISMTASIPSWGEQR